MTLIPHGTSRGAGTCPTGSHTWVPRRYEARDGARQTRMCSDCSRTEVVLPADRPREHQPTHALLRANAA